jgi:PAS domain S-box-containing protein
MQDKKRPGRQTCENDFLKPKDFKTILDNVYDQIYVTDAKGMVLYVNKATERNYGVKPEEFIGKDSLDISSRGYYTPVTGPIVRRDKKIETFEEKTVLGKTLVVTAVPVFDKNGNIDMVVWNGRDMMSLGKMAYDFEETKALLEKMQEEIKELRSRELETPDFVAVSDEMQNLVAYIHRLGKIDNFDSNILIRGESGTGKNILAKYIHRTTKANDLPFITINCSAIPDVLFEAELFGYVKGAFTGADSRGKIGLLDLANGGTLFLDEITEIPTKLQAKLLSVIQEHQFSPIGGRIKKALNCHIIAATNRDLDIMVKNGGFREDLLYRLNVIDIEVPPIRKRKSDIIPLLYSFLTKYGKKYNIFHEFTDESIDFLVNYDWPGNVREMEHVVERLFIGVESKLIQPSHVLSCLTRTNPNGIDGFHNPEDAPAYVDLNLELDKLRKALVEKACQSQGTTYGVAKALNISQSTAFRLIKKYVKD